MNAEVNLPEFLVECELITVEQRREAERFADQKRSRFSDELVCLGFAKEQAIIGAVAGHLGIPYASKENGLLTAQKEQDLQAIISEAFAVENMVLPLFLEGGCLAMAFGDMDNLALIGQVGVRIGYSIAPFVASRAEILDAISQYYGRKSESAGNERMDPAILHSPAHAPDASMQLTQTLDLDESLNPTERSHAVALVNAILKQAIVERSSDVHIEAYDNEAILRFRIDGVLYQRSYPPVEEFDELVSRLRVLAKIDIAEKRLPQDGAFSLKYEGRSIEVRIGICPAAYGSTVVMRLQDKRAVGLDIERAGFEPRQKEEFLAAAKQPQGLVILTGPVGSGKTTTLFSILNKILTPSLKFMTIEDPIEIRLKGLTQVQVKAAIGLTFASTLRAFLRQDPDVILVGEIRDADTARACLQAAMTGHLVFSSLHTNDAFSVIPRLVDLEIEPFLLAGCLTLVAAQRLVRVLCPHCKKAYRPDNKMLDLVSREALMPNLSREKELSFFEAVGCARCSGTGYRGRIGIHEVYRITPRMQEAIYSGGKGTARIKKIALEDGLYNLRASGWQKVLSGVTTVQEVLSMTASGV